MCLNLMACHSNKIHRFFSVSYGLFFFINNAAYVDIPKLLINQEKLFKICTKVSIYKHA